MCIVYFPHDPVLQVWDLMCWNSSTVCRHMGSTICMSLQVRYKIIQLRLHQPLVLGKMPFQIYKIQNIYFKKMSVLVSSIKIGKHKYDYLNEKFCTTLYFIYGIFPVQCINGSLGILPLPHFYCIFAKYRICIILAVLFDRLLNKTVKFRCAFYSQ